MEETSSEILVPVSDTIVIPAIPEKFVVADRFVVNTRSDAEVRISRLGEGLAELFLLGEGKVEPPMPEQVLSRFVLKRPWEDISIVNEFGGEAQAETTMSVAFSLMAQQPTGGEGILFTKNQKRNVLFVRSRKNVKDGTDELCAVVIIWFEGGWFKGDWFEDGWFVGARPVDNPKRFKWLDGTQIMKPHSPIPSCAQGFLAQA